MRETAAEAARAQLVDLDVIHGALVLAADGLLLSRSDPELDSQNGLARLNLLFDGFSQRVEAARSCCLILILLSVLAKNLWRLCGP
ncbi:hypothetical protein [Roseicyclus sp.]|uniref:hypothetical protein n=1 Tax=Roseicyclus sp. TaxID=1914329 RepID=UPI001BCE96FD|nr:hypothetical protein [Roseicyclus sp.]